MGVSHVKTNNVADATGTGTIWWGATTASVAATDMVRPSDWNSAHLQRLSFGGNTAGVASVTGTDVIFAGGNNVTLSAAQGAGVGTVSFIGANPGVSAFSAGTTRLTGGEAVLSDANGISFGMNGATITASHNALVKTDADALYFPRASSTAPNGFPDRTQLTMGWSNATRTVTLTPVAASFDVWSNGTKYTKSSAQTVTIANTTGLHYVYFDDSGTLVSTMTFGTNLILRWAIVAIIYWNATDGTAIPDCQVETHGTDWPPEVHLQQHLVAGCRYQSGLSVSVQPEQDGSSPSHIQVAVTSGYIWDEDIQHAVAARVAGDNIPVLYRSGASGVWSMSASSSAMVRTTGSGRAAFNEYTGGSWQQTEMTNGYYGVAYLYAMPSLTGAQQLVVVQGQAQYATQADAGAAAQQTPALGDLPLYEVKLIAAIVFQTDSALTNAVKSRTMRIGDSSGADFVDWRLQSAIVTDVGNLGDGYNIIAAGTQSALSTGTVLFSNSNNVTFGMTNSSVVTAAFALPVSGGTTSGALSSLVFSSGGNVTFGLDGSTLTASAPAGGGGGIAAAAGTQTATSGTVVFSNSNGVSFGMSGSTRVTASFSQSSATISAGTTSGTLGQLVFSNSGNVSFGLNAGTITATATVPAQTAQTLGIYASSNTTGASSSSTVDARSLTIVGYGVASVGMTNGSLAISVPSGGGAGDGYNILAAGTQTATTAGSVLFSNENGVTFGMQGSTRITASVAALTSATISAGTTTGTLGQLVFSNSNNMSFGLNAGTITGTVTVPAQTAQTVGWYALGNTTAQSSSSTWDARTLSVAGAGIISIGNSAGSGLVVSATQSNQALSGSNGSFAFQTATFGNLNGLSFYTSNGSFVGSYTVPTQSNQTLGLYASSNTTGAASSTTIDARSMTLVGYGIASVGMTNGSVAISVPSGGGAGDGVNILAAGTQTANTTGTVVFSNSNGVTFGMNNSSVITASVAAGSAPNRRYIEIMNGERLTSCAALSATQFSNRPIFSPFWLDGTGIQVNTMRFLVSGVGSSNRSFGGTFVAAIYSQANDTQLTLLSSDSQSFSITASSQSTLWNGMNVVDFTRMSNLTLTAEGRHVAAFMISPVSANATWMSAQLYGGDNLPAISRFLVGNTTSATNNTSNIFPFWGVYSTTSGAMPSTLHATQINGGNSASLVDYYCIIKEI